MPGELARVFAQRPARRPTAEKTDRHHPFGRYRLRRSGIEFAQKFNSYQLRAAMFIYWDKTAITQSENVKRYALSPMKFDNHDPKVAAGRIVEGSCQPGSNG
ncbi:hypothetical protein NWF24_14690 [Variovorax paradoxus]|uniref:hypothetical protein n=1 Tax=Variovorax paradoxus TaxID=34073 RepID=UPI0021ACCED3|nr:hypothetical protein [Variovorax paradoxus]UVH60608.1 hypothetical protein NWF24_14690 [Variovorax paradoxus]